MDLSRSNSSSPTSKSRKPSTSRVHTSSRRLTFADVQPSLSHTSYQTLSDTCHSQEIEIDEDLQMIVKGYRLSVPRKLLYQSSCFLSGGVLYLAGRWFPKLQLFAMYSTCSLSESSHVYIENQWSEGCISPVTDVVFQGEMRDAFPKEEPLSAGPAKDSNFCQANTTESIPVLLNNIKTFEYRYIKFIYNPNPKEGLFVPNDIWRDYRWTSVDAVLEGISSRQRVEQRKLLFGENEIKIQEKPTSRLLLDEVLHPFFLFQIGSMVLWSLDNYYQYATCIFIISAVSVLTTLYETKQNMRKLREFSTFSCSVRVWRLGTWLVLPSSELVSGDVFEITSGFMSVFPADAVLLSGDCIVNESMLTGESVPISKSPITDTELASLDFEKEDPASISSMSRYFLFSGTKIIRSRSSINTSNNTPNHSSSVVDLVTGSQQHLGGALALVVRTGFNTTKGNLIRSMLFPKPNKFKFYRDSFRFIGVLSIIAGLGFLASCYNFYSHGVAWSVILVRALDLITIVVPPALPATMAIGTTFAINRLKKGYIFCISPPRVNICGKIDLMAFDKTGTLTEEGLDVLGFRFTAPAGKGGLEAVGETKPVTEPLVKRSCRFSRLYTGTELVIPRPIHQGNGQKTTPEDSYSPTTYKTAVSGVSLNFFSVPSHPNADLDFAYPLIICAMATCHSVKLVNGELVGDPMDLKMFEFTRWELFENSGQLPLSTGNISLVKPPSSSPISNSPGSAENTDRARVSSQLGVVRTFDFVSELRRMGVIVQRFKGSNLRGTLAPDHETNYEAYVKGAPEVIRSICLSESIPANYDEQLRYYAHHGYRVIAIAHRQLESLSPLAMWHIRRSEVERNLLFLGFIVFENKLKPGTSSVVEALHQANIRQVMVTGDNVLTSISISRECGLVNPLARIYVSVFTKGDPIDPEASIAWENVDGGDSKVDPVTFQEINWDSHVQNSEYYLAISGDVFAWMLDFASEEILQKMLVKCHIFARMSPDQKHFLVERFQELGYCVGFTGDGSNDCGALKNADVGLSLSEAEASVAAPFTSQSKDLSCVLRIIREGRAALVTSFSCFKYMALYSVIQFTTVSILYAQNNNLGDSQYMYIDLFIIIPIAIFMGQSGPYPLLSRKRPTASLVSKTVLTSLLGQIAINAVIQFWSFFWVRSQLWYQPGTRAPGEDDAMYPSFENTILFYLSSFQYMIVAAVYNEGPPYRENMIRNVPFMSTILFLWGFTTWSLFYPSPWMLETLELVAIPLEARWYLALLTLINFTVCWGCEIWLFKRLAKWIESGWWSIKFLQQNQSSAIESVEAGNTVDAEQGQVQKSRATKRLKWAKKGKIFKLVQEELSYNAGQRHGVIHI